MALALADRVQETTTTSGTGTITLDGAVPGFQQFVTGIGSGNTTFYTIYDPTSYEWEVGIGTFTSSTSDTLSRDTVLSNSLGTTAKINLAGNQANVFVTYPSEKSVNLNVAGVMEVGEPLGYSDTGLLATFTSTEAGYNQVVVQNKSNATNASANINISNDVSTDTTGFAELGINSSQFTGTGSFSIAGAAYLASAGTDLVIGTYNANDIHFVTNSNTTDAMVIHDDGGIALGGLADPGIGNIACNNINLKFQQVLTTGGTTTLTNASPYYTQFTGTNVENLVLPDATTCLVGTTFIFDNDSTQNVTIKDGSGTTFELLVPGGFHNFVLEDNSTVAGTWLRYSSVPSTVEWGTYSLSLGATTITGGVWNGGTIPTGYGGTGLTGFGAANYALYSTSSSALTAGTLPVAAGGTGKTTFTSGYIPYGDGTNPLATSSSLQFSSGVLVVGGTTPLGGTTNPITAFSGSANQYVQTYIYNANSGDTASADFAAYADNSTDAHGWMDMGYTSSTYASTDYSVTGPNEAYVLGSAPSGSTSTGNLVYATDSTGSANAHQWYVGGFNQLKSAWKMQLTSTGLQLANALGIAYGGTGNTSGQAASVANALSAGTGLGFTSGTSYNGSAARTLKLADTTVTAGSYTLASITVDAQGRLTAASSGTAPVSSVSGTAPISSSGGTNPTISISQAGSSTNGYLSSTDWNTFNGKGTGSVTSVSGTGSYGGLSLSGTVTTSGNITLGGTPTGTWPIDISGAAASATNATNAGNLTGTAGVCGYSTSGQAIAYTSTGGPQVTSQGGGAAMLSFHRPGAYAINFGLDTDNQLKYGGWSIGAASYVLYSQGNASTYFTNSFGGTNGYQIFPNGMKINWGVATVNNSTQNAFTSAFSNAVRSIVCTWQAGSPSRGIEVTTRTTTYFIAREGGAGTGSSSAFYVAIGY